MALPVGGTSVLDGGGSDPSNCGIPSSGVTTLSHRSDRLALTVNYCNVQSHYLSLTSIHFVTFRTRYPIDTRSISVEYLRLSTRPARSAVPHARSRPDLEEFLLDLNPIHGRVQTPLARDRSDVPKSPAGRRLGSGSTRSEPISDGERY